MIRELVAWTPLCAHGHHSQLSRLSAPPAAVLCTHDIAHTWLMAHGSRHARLRRRECRVYTSVSVYISATRFHTSTSQHAGGSATHLSLAGIREPSLSLSLGTSIVPRLQLPPPSPHDGRMSAHERAWAHMDTSIMRHALRPGTEHGHWHSARCIGARHGALARGLGPGRSLSSARRCRTRVPIESADRECPPRRRELVREEAVPRSSRGLTTRSWAGGRRPPSRR